MKLRQRARRAARRAGMPLPYRQLSPPLLTLYVSPVMPHHSRIAFCILQRGQTGFRVALSSDGQVGAEMFGRRQMGLDGVSRLDLALRRFEATLLKPTPEIIPEFRKRRSWVIGWLSRRELRAQMREAERQYNIIMQSQDW